MSSCAQDRSFGPGSSCRDLDFTLYFEQSVLSLSPDVIFVALAVLRLAFLRSQTAPVRNSKLGYALLVPKGVAALFVVATTIASLVYSHRGHVLIAAPIVQILSALMLVILVIAEHFKSVTPSTLIIVYAFCKGVFTAAIMRSSLMIGDSRLITLALQLAAAAYFLLSLAELLGKRRALVNTTVPRVSSSSFISRAFYVWLIPLLWSGRKKTLTIADCGAIPHEMGANASTEPLHALLVTIPKGEHYLVRASLKAFPLQFLSPIIPRILLLVALFMQPLLAAGMIEFISHPEQPSDRGWALAGGFVCTYALIFLMTSIYWEKVFDCTVLYRGALVGNIYRKTLHLSSASGREVGGGVASTYMSVDVERVCLGLETFHELWAAIISIILAVALLYSQATWPAFFPLVITVFMIVIAGYVSKGIGAAHGAWMGSTDKRIKFLSSIINNYLPMKLSHYENVFATRAAKLRTDEMKGARSFYYNITVTGTLASTAWAACTLSVLGPYAALAAHDHHRGVLDPERIFTIVATINLMSPPLILLGSSMPQLQAAYASLKRIQKYLSLEERDDVLLRNDENEHRIPSTEKGREASEDIKIEGASFSWAADKPAFLGPLSLVLTPGHLHLCTGPVASGKTVFLLSVLGETVCTAGHFVPPRTSIAYASQDPLIVPGTIRDNVVFGQVFVEQWYNVVLEACALATEIDRMNAKDGTFLGEKGATLSGGQRQRISLARAIYAKAPWTFLDDPFSSLDAETEKHVFSALFGSNGLLRNKGVVLVTNNANHLNYADRVIVLNAGAMQYEGTLDKIRAAGYQFDHYARKEDPQESETSDKPEAVAPTKKHVAEKERAEAPILESSLGLTPYLFYLRMAGWSGSIVVLVFFVIAGLVRLALQIYLQQWSESNGRHPGIWVGGYSALTVGNMLAIAVGMWVFTIVITGPVGANLHAAQLRGLLETSCSFYSTTPAGRIINRFSQDIFMCDLDFPRNIFDVILPLVIIVGSLVFILIPTPWLTLAVPFLGALYWIILSFYLKTAKQFQQLGAASKSPLYTQFSTTLVGLVTIRALRAEKYFQDQNDVHLDQSQIPFYLRFASIRFLRAFLAMISFILAAGLAFLAVGLRHSTNPSLLSFYLLFASISHLPSYMLASLGLALANLTSMSGQLSGLLMSLSGLENASVAVSRIHEIASLPKENDPAEVSDEKKVFEKTPPSDSTPHGAVTFRNVRLRYQDDLDFAIDDISFEAPAGYKIGICGRTGSGKSSLIMALFRAVDPSLMSGQVLIDGVDTRTIRLGELRDSLSLVAQSPFIWNAPLRYNLDPHGEYTDAQIWVALERIGLNSAVSDLPDKLETMMDDGGSLSAGQRQLLCIARILLRRRKIVVLDEASSSLDADTDTKIREIVRTDLSDSTVIAVAHRIQTILDFDVILVLDKGKLVESGSPKELLSRSDSRFRKLASSQGIADP
ncbi:P-loop containing nucleoside triphosphate hydrolase protein [Mycena rebaudengoi]|nr:P-loop containing nucleoside triphosphate hydrolase protein [Mycena rebaudengoi]